MKKDQVIIKKSNIKLFLSALLENRPISRTDLAKKIDISPTSITRISSLLISKGLVVETDTTSKGVGRHAVMLDTVPGSAYAMGIEIKSHSVNFAITDLHGDCIDFRKVKCNVADYTIEDFAKKIYDNGMEVISSNNISYEKIIGIGVAIPGIVNHENDTVELSTQLQWKNQSILPYLRPLFNKPMIIENDTKAKIRGEKALHNIPDGIDSAVVSIGSGLSAAAVSHENIVRGFRNAAGEIGHISVEADGIMCDCGRHGCLQTRLCDKFLIAEAQKHDKGISALSQIVSAYNSNVSWAAEIMGKFKNAYYMTLDILESCYNPAVIIVSGQVVESMKPLLELWAAEYLKIKDHTVSVIVTTASNNTAAAGCSIIALDTFITDIIDDINI